MIVPEFTFDAEANGYISEPIEFTGRITVKMELIARAPVVILRQEADGGYANYGQSPQTSDNYEFNVRWKEKSKCIIKLATPVQVRSCWVVD